MGEVMGEKSATIYVCSDAVGETAEAVVSATIRQFTNNQMKMKRFSHIESATEIEKIVDEVSENGGFIAYTLVQPDLRLKMKQESIFKEVRAVDVMGPMMQAYIDTFNDAPKPDPGQRQVLDAEYFRRIEAVEFAVKYDDGKDFRGLKLADVVLIGVSRTSKTPLSIFLAHKGIKSANVPIVLDANFPDLLFENPKPVVVGLTIDQEHLVRVRTERLKALGLPDGAKYASIEQIETELDIARKLMEQIDCPIINVSDKSIEETAGIIMDILEERATKK